MNPRALRLLRGAVVTGTAVALASTAHLAAGGDAPGLAGLLIAFVLGTALGTALLSRARLTLVRTAAVIVVGQWVFHTVFAWGSVTPTPVAPTAPDAHAHDAVSPLSFSLSAPDALHEHGATTMLLAHVVAGLLSLAVLLAEQRLLDRVVAVARRAVARVLEFGSSAVVLPILPRVSAVCAQRRPRVAPACSPSRPRGPPALALAA